MVNVIQSGIHFIDYHRQFLVQFSGHGFDMLRGQMNSMQHGPDVFGHAFIELIQSTVNPSAGATQFTGELANVFQRLANIALRVIGTVQQFVHLIEGRNQPVTHILSDLFQSYRAFELDCCVG